MCMLGFSAHSFKYTHKFLVCVRMDYIWKDTKETANNGYSREGRTGFSLCTLLYISDFCHHGMCYLFKIRWIKKKVKGVWMTWEEGPFPWRVPPGSEELRVWLQPAELVLWKAWSPKMHLYSTPHLSRCSQSLHSHLPGRALETGLASLGCVWGVSDHCI